MSTSSFWGKVQAGAVAIILVGGGLVLFRDYDDVWVRIGIVVVWTTVALLSFGRVLQMRRR